MNTLRKISLIMGLLMISPTMFAAGKITGINFSGPDDVSHPNIVQIQIEGGFNSGDCDFQYAAIRNTPDRKHLISFALTAYTTKEPVSVALNVTDKYYGSRCTISTISSVY